MQLPAAAARAPTWFSTRRLLDEKLSDLHRCSNLNTVKQIQAQVFKNDLHQDPYVAPKLVAAFSLSRHLPSAVNAFNLVTNPNTHLYNTLIRAQAQNKAHPSVAFETFFQMQRNGVFSDSFTYTCLLKSFDGYSCFRMVQMIHTHVVKFGFFGSDIFVPNSLIDSYCKCGGAGMDAAIQLFLEMEERDVVTWNSLIGGLVRGGEFEKACKVFDEMPERDVVSWNIMLDGYAKAGQMGKAFEMFEGMPERNVVSWASMVWGYCRAGDMNMARMLFDKCPGKNLVIWTTMISGYAEKGLVNEATKLYDKMEGVGMRIDDGFLISILAACAESGMSALGKRIHASVERRRLRCSTKVLNAFIDMYAKCGCVDVALGVFSRIEKKDLVSWNSMIQGLGIHGRGEKALELFTRMVHEGFEPDKYTFIGLLCACTHAGLVNEGRNYFYSMEKVHGIVPQVEHYGCMIDLLGRGGNLEEAFQLVRSMPMEPNEIVLGTLLGACRMHNDVDLAKAVCEHLFELAPLDPGNFNLLSNIYAQAGDWVNVASVRWQMKNTGSQKPSGASSIEVEEEVHEFTAFDQSHPKSDDIYRMIDRLIKDIRQVGYVPKAYVSRSDAYSFNF
ncbi:pentatricopeptide repeat-containing protein At3g29230-like [Arachis stenosperma]|uniref:pentatricopeptide repeat-containing protein At3g29230-like n=1 Tax=Arachis stenosperma TaxID=217475 RepID=UPI0025ABF7C1|nr:pentatricopeptide repeat-containing protein At3g29230-like [Arachis stenosperma]XP_057761218.1 pentatricopeptide repeat-containing protein At3g29230-like [Arachis stenosperma]XP_057761219.1 pentatricopeptide repeat-containing protein At3g29230-like [Arachis stenosperma]XP_057761220.1 pentatricopeptide repeat-containing protein At3g29230-like [Arachis stenosperma]XP_057761221.1 pentatricopeptide repeat-containing protein At3g29230-like [Arachis stenosperma]XP_057761222.1 pentatricopeptide re